MSRVSFSFKVTPKGFMCRPARIWQVESTENPDAQCSGNLPGGQAGVCGQIDAINAIGSAVASTIQCGALHVREEATTNATINVVVAATNDGVSSALAAIVSSLRDEQRKRHLALAEIDVEAHRRRLAELKAARAVYVQRELLPDATHLDSFARQIEDLQRQVRPMSLIEAPRPGRVSQAIAKSATNNVLALYDNRAFAELIAKATSRKASLDLELFCKAWRRQIFDAAFLEGVQPAPVDAPLAAAIVIASPETVARFLMSKEPMLAAFADTCLIIDADRGLDARTTNRPQLAAAVGQWARQVSELLNQDHENTLGLTDSAAKLIDSFRSRVVASLKQKGRESLVFTRQLPRLAATLSLISRAGSQTNRPVLVFESHAAQAVGITERSIQDRTGLIKAWAEAIAQTNLENACTIAVDKVAAYGPISRRDLSRKYHDQKIAPLCAVLRRALDTGQLVETGDGRLDIPRRRPTTSPVRVCCNIGPPNAY